MALEEKLKTYLESFLEVVFTRNCQSCGVPLKEGEVYVCDRCLERELERNKQVKRCKICSSPLPVETVDVCFECRSREFHFDSTTSLFDYSGLLKRMFGKFKFDGDRKAGEVLAGLIADALDLNFDDYDFVVPVPVSREKLKERGFNQVEVLFGKALERNGWDFDRVLVRKGTETAQKFLTMEERREFISGQFDVLPDFELGGSKVLLLDDVFTTGSTLDECARVLKKNGAETVDCIVAFRVSL